MYRYLLPEWEGDGRVGYFGLALRVKCGSFIAVKLWHIGKMNKKKVTSVCIAAAVALLLSVGCAWLLYPAHVCKIIGKIERRFQQAEVNWYLDSYVQKT